MFYCYGDFIPNFDVSKIDELADRLKIMLREYNIANVDGWSKGRLPYVEIIKNEVYIRRITNLSDDFRDIIVKKADQIYEEVMGKVKK